MGLKMTFGRKFVVWLSVTACLVGLLIMFALTLNQAVNAAVLITYGILITTMGMMYVGGNVWNKWVKSKFFKSEIADRNIK